MNNRRPPQFDRNWAFFFDIDGTLAEIAQTPDEAQIPSATIDDLLSLQKSTGVALVSGRSIASIDALTRPTRFPAAGQHGLELRLHGHEIIDTVANRAAMDDLVARVKLFHTHHPGLIVEYKGLSIALHYRIRADLGATILRFLEMLMKEREGLFCLQHGKMVHEIRLCGGNKGTAITAFMRTKAFQNRLPVFAGDDETDEEAYKYINSMHGVSIQIGVSSPNAKFSFESPSALRKWIHEIVNLEMAAL